jgi:hypothetical protein
VGAEGEGKPEGRGVGPQMGSPRRGVAAPCCCPAEAMPGLAAM